MADTATTTATANATPVPADNKDLQRFMKRYQRAKAKRDLMAPLIDECYEFALPLRERSYCSGGQLPSTDRLFDSTAPTALQDAASQMLDDVWPTDSKPFELKAGRDVPEDERMEVDRALSEVSAEIIESINNSNFRDAAHEALMDWGIASGFLLPEKGDATDPLRFRCLPLTEAIPDTGPFDTIDANFRPRTVLAGDLTVLWPGANLTEELRAMAQNRPDEKVEIIEGAERDWKVKGTETWRFKCVATKQNHELVSGTYGGWGSKPFIDFHFMRVAGEVLGRGPVMLALPDIKTLNLTKELILENGDLAISGAYQYDDDGVVNPDTVTIEPRSLIPRAPGSKGLEAIKSASNFDVGELIVKDLQSGIRMVILGDDLGPVKNSPMSATEVLERTSNRARRRAGPYTRLITGLLFQTVRGTARILIDQGRIKLPRIDGRTVVFRPLSPITRAQAQDAVLRHDRWIELMNARFGQQMTGLTCKVEDYAVWLGNQLGVEPRLIRTRVEREKLMQGLAQMATQAPQPQAA
jgi:hypothetical protein